jgi:hypothetical protein
VRFALDAIQCILHISSHSEELFLITTAAVQATFVAACRDLPEEAAAQIAHALQGGGALDSLIAQAAHDGAEDPLRDLLAYREAVREQADPPRLLARLIAEGADLDHRSDRLAEQAAEFFGKAAYRRLRADCHLAADFQRRAEAAEQAGAGLRERAFKLRLEADRLRARTAQATALHTVVAAA